MDTDTQKLLSALDNESNDGIMNLTTKKINQINLKVVNHLDLKKDDKIQLMKKINGYKYVDELDSLKYGAFIKWIPISDSNHMPLHSGGMICDIKLTDTGVYIVCKNFKHRFFQFKMDECLIFQKLTNQENILLSALDHLSDK
jgi:hypothetical protein